MVRRVATPKCDTIMSERQNLEADLKTSVWCMVGIVVTWRLNIQSQYGVCAYIPSCAKAGLRVERARPRARSDPPGYGAPHTVRAMIGTATQSASKKPGQGCLCMRIVGECTKMCMACRALCMSHAQKLSVELVHLELIVIERLFDYTPAVRPFTKLQAPHERTHAAFSVIAEGV